MKTINTWVSEHHFESSQENNKINIDGNKEKGMSPKALLLSGLAGCSGIDVVDILEKMRVELTGLIVEVEAEQTDGHPRVFKEINITYRVKTAVDNEEKVRKAIEL